MADHKKPTQEELDAQIEASLKEIDTPEETAKEVEPSIEAPVEEEKQEEVVEEEVKPSEEDKETLKKRYQDSSREAQLLYSKNKKMAEAIEKVGEVEITEEELKAEYQEWEMMTDFEKKMARESAVTKKSLAAIKEATKEFKDMDVWNGKVDEFMADPKTFISYPGLEGKEDEFKLFTAKPTRRGIDFADLVSAFMYTSAQAKPKNKGSMMPTGTAGADKSKKSDGKVSLQDAQVLRRTNYKQYLDLLKAGKISEEI